MVQKFHLVFRYNNVVSSGTECTDNEPKDGVVAHGCAVTEP